ncbi:DUF3592 domain-containing protein [Sphaerisporangium fuscum]|uniref:DUF3592 domain-containing protein n=1 Tax=Sphaerisporangium fuscum TaxID=2835868 RepID=UPI001BDBC233|nr:DUF3592 domain-containing protein [Sphaerisporangium fuscum]
MSPTAWIVLGLGLGALAFGGVGAGLLVSHREFRRIAQRAQGQVVHLRRGSTEGGYVYYPTIRFVTAYGQQIEAETNYGSNPPVAPVGGLVAVLYDPEKPSRVRVDSVWGGGVAVGAIFAASAVLLVVVAAGVVLFGA